MSVLLVEPFLGADGHAHVGERPGVGVRVRRVSLEFRSVGRVRSLAGHWRRGFLSEEWEGDEQGEKKQATERLRFHARELSEWFSESFVFAVQKLSSRSSTDSRWLRSLHESGALADDWLLRTGLATAQFMLLP